MSSTKPAASKAGQQAAEEKHLTELAEGIEQTRSEMSATITAIEHRLSPAELGEQAKAQLEHIEARVKILLKEGLTETKEVLEGQIEAAKGAVHEQIQDAKGAVKEQLHEAKEMVTQGLSDAREAVKEDIKTAITNTKQTIRDATLGRVETVATQAGDVMNDAKDTLLDTIRQNPIPAALAGVGLAWLLMNRSSSSRRRTRSSGRNGNWDDSYGRSQGGSGAPGAMEGVERVAGRLAHGASNLVHGAGSAVGQATHAMGSAAHDATAAVRGAVGEGVEAASHLVDQTTAAAGRVAHDAADMTGRLVHGASETAGQLAAQAQAAATDFAHSARDGAYRAERTLASTFDSNPLVVGAVAIAAGAAVGYSLPRTQREDALMGGMRDQVFHGATALAHDAAQSVHRLAEKAGDTARKSLSESAK